MGFSSGSNDVLLLERPTVLQVPRSLRIAAFSNDRNLGGQYLRSASVSKDAGEASESTQGEE